MKNNDFFITLHGARAEELKPVLGTTTLVIQNPVPEKAKLPGGVIKVVYYLDLGAINSVQRTNLVKHIAKKFNLEEKFVDENLETQGVPILAEDCTLTIKNPNKWLN